MSTMKPLEPLRGAQLILLTLALALAVFMSLLDFSIANVSVPYIAGEVAVSHMQATFVTTAFFKQHSHFNIISSGSCQALW